MPVAYRGAAYWETETPSEARAGSVLLKHFPKAGKLQVHREFVNGDGERRSAGVVTLDADALALAPEARGLLIAFARSAAALGGTDESITAADRRRRGLPA